MNIKIEEIVAALINGELSGAEAIADLHAIVKAGQATLRDEFAAQALISGAASEQHIDDIAHKCYLIADAMIKARSQ